ncbi:hypothetical protein [Legionella sainthelensi]|uniref:Uncharacterized protein n=1 Tax=Legionella sainthelensi TaxID=28087 RepID=A0A2H5FHR4_9GAMM|nr:hypothetical protein [Legionella sainthelensi]AUH71088.1 hypothetical protein CAB17_02695 [Legionella sainthelensi]
MAFIVYTIGAIVMFQYENSEVSAPTKIAIFPLNYNGIREKYPDLDIKVISPFLNIWKRGER